MRSYLLALAVLGAGFAVQSAPAEARNYPFCLQGRDISTGQGDCSYATYQQCQATAAGTYAGCYANPYYVYDDEDRAVSQPRRRAPRPYY
ncbi:MAG: DUF3551 domain-containing protein [Pseudomonadota bacterium]|nr:DUF3551 domain-containing protein [Afipia sp.]